VAAVRSGVPGVHVLQWTIGGIRPLLPVGSRCADWVAAAIEVCDARPHQRIMGTSSGARNIEQFLRRIYAICELLFV